MKLYKQAELSRLYANIFETGYAKIMEGGSVDPLAALPDADDRMAVALVIRIPAEIRNRILGGMQPLRSEMPELYYYPGEDMHITLLEILRGRKGLRRPDAGQTEQYTACIKAALRGNPPFSVFMQGLTASDGAVMAKGFYEEPLERIRRGLRAVLREKGIFFEERYETYSCHITAARFPEKISNPGRLIKFLEENAETVWGSWKVKTLELTYHNWYDSKKETLETFTLPGNSKGKGIGKTYGI